MFPNNRKTNPAKAASRHIFPSLLGAEKKLWSKIHDEIRRNLHSSTGSVLASIIIADPTILFCPASKTRLFVNPDLDLWQSMKQPDGLAIVAAYPINDGDNPSYLAIRFDGEGERIAELPAWAQDFWFTTVPDLLTTVASRMGQLLGVWLSVPPSEEEYWRLTRGLEDNNCRRLSVQDYCYWWIRLGSYCCETRSWKLENLRGTWRNILERKSADWQGGGDVQTGASLVIKVSHKSHRPK